MMTPTDWQTLAERLEEQCSPFCAGDYDSPAGSEVAGQYSVGRFAISFGGLTPSPRVETQSGQLPVLGAENPAGRLLSALESIRNLLRRLREFKRGRCDASDVVTAGSHALEAVRFLAGISQGQGAALAERCAAFAECLQAIPSVIDGTITQRRDFYVYAHCDKEGRPFYIGMGWDRSAWSVDHKNQFWRYYVSERLRGAYEVAILRSGLTGDEADAYKNKLIEQYGEQLLNLEGNPYRNDLPACTRYHELRDANRRFVIETKPFESTDLQVAVARYKDAIAKMREYEHIETVKGLLGDVIRAMCPRTGDLAILDRLTLCLFKLGRFDEVIRTADDYFSEFPDASQRGAGRQVLRRVDRARSAIGRP